MAKQLAFDDACGNTAASCYWRIVQVNIGVADRTAAITLYGYKDQASRAANKQPLSGAVRQYVASGADFDALMAAHLAPGGKNLLKLAYENVVAAAKEVLLPGFVGPDADGKFHDSTGEEVVRDTAMGSFFSEAFDV